MATRWDLTDLRATSNAPCILRTPTTTAFNFTYIKNQNRQEGLPSQTLGLLLMTNQSDTKTGFVHFFTNQPIDLKELGEPLKAFFEADSVQDGALLRGETAHACSGPTHVTHPVQKGHQTRNNHTMTPSVIYPKHSPAHNSVRT